MHAYNQYKDEEESLFRDNYYPGSLSSSSSSYAKNSAGRF